MSQFTYCCSPIFDIHFILLATFKFILFLISNFSSLAMTCLDVVFFVFILLEVCRDSWVTLSKFGKFLANIFLCFVRPILSHQSFWISHRMFILLLISFNKSFQQVSFLFLFLFVHFWFFCCYSFYLFFCFLFISSLFSLCASAYMIAIVLSSNSLIFLLLCSVYFKYLSKFLFLYLGFSVSRISIVLFLNLS